MKKGESLWADISSALKEGRDPAEFEAELWRLYGETRAVMVLDASSFTLASRERGVVFFLSMISRFRELGRSILEEYGAKGVRTEADNLYADFANPDQGLAAALALHRQVSDLSWDMLPRRPFRVCIGLGFGTMLRSKREGFFGDEMNLASKLGEDLASAGETLLSESAYNNLSRTQGLIFEPRSELISNVELRFFSVRLSDR